MRWLGGVVLVGAWGCDRVPPTSSSSSVPHDTGPPDTDDTDPTLPPSGPVSMALIGFNVESGGSDPGVVAVDTVAPVVGEAIWGFAEVEDRAAAELLVPAANDPGSNQDFRYVLGTTGYHDLLALAWDNALLELVSYVELDDINVGGTARAPLVGTLRDRATGLTFELVVNHLWRSDDAARHEQAQLLNAWGAEQTLPVVMIGDYNFDWDVVDGAADHDQGYDLLTAGGVFTWVRPPEPLLKTNCSGYNTVLDFGFVGGEAQTWPASAEILDQDPDYCRVLDPETHSDHRPVRLTLELPGTP